MSTPAPSATMPVATSASPEQPLINLHILSPSLSVNRALLFPNLPATTTIKALKEKIRQTLPLRPADDHQCLIHRGRALLRESDTLMDVFGPEALRILDRQTIHLVVKDAPDGQTSTSPVTSRAPSPAESIGLQPHSHPQPPNGPEPARSLPHRAYSHTNTHHLAQPRVPSGAAGHQGPERLTTLQQQQHNMSSWLSHVQRDARLQREAMFRASVSQNQRGRAQMGMRGIGDAPSSPGPGVRSGRVSPGSSPAIRYETTGPNGQHYQVDTVVRSSTPGGAPNLSPADVQSIIRNADYSPSVAAMASALQRNVPGAALYNRPLTQPGVTTPVYSAAGSLAGSGRATPEMDPRLLAVENPRTARANSPGQIHQGPQIYLLLSPEGPRALLFNSSAAEAYYTPRLGDRASVSRFRIQANQSNLGHPAHLHDAHVAPQQEAAQEQDIELPPQNGAAAAMPAHARPRPRPLHAEHPAIAAGFPRLILQFWPHVWLMFRLGLFVWFFTSPNSSWSRWLTIISLAAFMFVLSTGLLNGFAENVWRPIGRHLDNVLPALEPRRIDREAGSGPRDAHAGGQDGQARPEDLAVRLIAERGARPGWMVEQLRRLERAGLLFLASLAPGVAERHIANVEALENRRREREAAAAAAATNAADGENEVGNENGVDGENGVNGSGAGEASTSETPRGIQEEQVSEQASGHAQHAQANVGNESNREEVAAL